MATLTSLVASAEQVATRTRQGNCPVAPVILVRMLMRDMELAVPAKLANTKIRLRRAHAVLVDSGRTTH